MDTRKWLLPVGVSVLLLIGSVRSQDVKSIDSDLKSNVLVSGEIAPITNEPHIYQGETVFTEDAHAVVTLAYYEGFSVFKRTHRIPEIKGFPISFQVKGDPKKFFARPGGSYPSNYYSISATVYLGVGDKVYIGDFMTDILYQVNGPTPGQKIMVTGLEACSTPGGGGACATEQRPQ